MRNNSGQSLFEVVISLAVITTIVVALIILASNSIRNTTASRNRTLATRHSQEAMEWLRGERDDDWETFAFQALTPSYCLPELSWGTAIVGSCGDTDTVGTTGLKREVAFTTVDSANIQAEIIVFWEDAQGLHEVRVATNLTDWRTN